MKHYKLTIPGLLPGLNEYVDAERGAKGKYKAAAMKKHDKKVISGQLVQEFLFVFAEALKFVQDSGEVRHAGADLFVDSAPVQMRIRSQPTA